MKETQKEQKICRRNNKQRKTKKKEKKEKKKKRINGRGSLEKHLKKAKSHKTKLKNEGEGNERLPTATLQKKNT